MEILRTFLRGHINWLDKQFESEKTLVEAMNRLCAYPCDPKVIEDGIASPKSSPEGSRQSTAVPPAPDRREAPPAPERSEEGKVNGFNKIIKDKHLYIIRNGETYSVDGKRVK